MASSISIEDRVAHLRDELERLAAELSGIGFTAAGSLVRRYTHCASDGCRCNADPPQPHGPYWQWSKAVDGKTVTKRLREDQVPLYQEWIANRRRLRRVVAQMAAVSEQATRLLLSQANGHPGN
ncbi:MAG: hypothetical protein M0T80_08270 [Actinomycetota bacterium]|jgi:hypothetical protein|nr:hypothetical protein [Actinomycetota bacterium]